MIVHIERIKSLFPKAVCKKMMKIPPSYGQCAYNSVKAALEFTEYDIRYCEGWIYNSIGHAFNKYIDENGNEHYFDLSQEYINRNKTNGSIKDVDLESELDTDLVVDTFSEDKVTHLITVGTWRGNLTYAQLKERGFEKLYFD